MNKGLLADTRELLSRALSGRTSEKISSRLPVDVADLYVRHHDLASQLKVAGQNTSEAALSGCFEALVRNLNDNMEILLQMAGDLTNRKILPYEASEDDTLWKLSKKHHSEIQEICDINNIKDILRPYEKKILLIPVK